jgi:uncharacterized RmlC-like cupin family protein
MTTVDAPRPVSHVTPSERVLADPTPGMVREQAVSVDGIWAGLVRTEAQMISGWHHHGEHDSTIFVVRGALRMESGPGGADVVEARAGDFVHVPKGAIHREGNPSDEESHIVVVRAGRGPTTINVEGPAPGR